MMGCMLCGEVTSEGHMGVLDQQRPEAAITFETAAVTAGEAAGEAAGEVAGDTPLQGDESHRAAPVTRSLVED